MCRYTSGADANKADAAGVTPLYFAAIEGHDDIVKTLLAAPGGVDVDAASGDSGTTPLLVAAYKGNEEVMRLLISAAGRSARRPRRRPPSK